MSRKRTTNSALELDHPSSDMKGKFKSIDALIATDGPMDGTEQEALIQEFEQIQLSSTRTWRRVFGIGAAALGVCFLVFAWRQHTEPWGMRFTSELKTVTDAHHVSAILALQGASMLASAVGMLIRLPPKGSRDRGCLPHSLHQRLWMWGGTFGALCGGLYWTHAMWSMLEKYGSKEGSRASLWWLPIGPLVAALLCQYVIATLNSSGAEVRKLRQFKYTHEKV